MKPLLPNIEIGIMQGRVALRIHDVELSDFIEDYLTEKCELSPETVSPPGESTVGVTLYFDANVPLNKVKDALMKLSRSEIESIFRVNNP